MADSDPNAVFRPRFQPDLYWRKRNFLQGVSARAPSKPPQRPPHWLFQSGDHTSRRRVYAPLAVTYSWRRNRTWLFQPEDQTYQRRRVYAPLAPRYSWPNYRNRSSVTEQFDYTSHAHYRYTHLRAHLETQPHRRPVLFSVT